MPTCEIITNVQPADAQALSAKASALVAELLSKPLGYVLAFVTVNPSLTFGGTDLPAAYVTIGSIGSVGGDKNSPIVAGITDFVSRELTVRPDRIYVGIHDIPPADFGHNGRTFA
ncbi:Tautomerase/MIF [Martensiomyces pterosporus]|nr:Tautomerase/MIF [Martensiomyces pterosporus]